VDIIEFWNQQLVRNIDVDEPEFERLYCRKGPMYLPFPGPELVRITPLLQIANLTAKKPQTGAFTRLIAKIESAVKTNIFVENVFNENFAAALPRMGFIRLDLGSDCNATPCFLKLNNNDA